MLRTVAGLAVTATLATAAPALATPYQDLRSADAREAARLAIAEQRMTPPQPTQDLRSPDTRDAARGVIVGAGVTAPVSRVAPAATGFDWGDAALGAAASFGAMLLLAGAGARVLRTRPLRH
jgi:hypothetical protein